MSCSLGPRSRVFVRGRVDCFEDRLSIRDASAVDGLHRWGGSQPNVNGPRPSRLSAPSSRALTRRTPQPATTVPVASWTIAAPAREAIASSLSYPPKHSHGRKSRWHIVRRRQTVPTGLSPYCDTTVEPAKVPKRHCHVSANPPSRRRCGSVRSLPRYLPAALWLGAS